MSAVLIVALVVVGGGEDLRRQPDADFTALAANDSPAVTVLEDKTSGSVQLWHLYERIDATTAVGDEISFVGRASADESLVLLEGPPWLTVAF